MSPLQTEIVSGLSTGHRSPLSLRDLPVCKGTSTLSVQPHARERPVANDAFPVSRRPQLVPQSFIRVTVAIGTLRPENAAEMVRHGLPAVFAVYYVCGRLYDSVA